MEDNLFDVLGFNDSDKKTIPSLMEFLMPHYPLRTGHGVTDKYRPFKIDDRNSDDVIQNFCEISVAIPDPEDGFMLLELYDLPTDSGVRALISQRQHEWTHQCGQTLVRIAISVKDSAYVRKLALAIRKV